MQRLLLIDGNSLFHRAYHALPPLTDKHGEMANAVFGFSNMLLKAIGEVAPDYIACAFDTKAPTFRHIEFEKYKAQRAAPPPDLYPQLPKVKKVLDAFGISYFEKEGYEADDIIATLASLATHPSVIANPSTSFDGTQDKSLSVNSMKQSKKKIATSFDKQSFSTNKLRTRNDKLIDQVVILSGDRDVLQLVNGNIKVQMPSFTSSSAEASKDTKVTEGKPGWGILMGVKEVREKYRIEPRQVVDWKSLTGDTSDNVPGVAGIGPKTASELLQKYDNLEMIYKRIDEVPSKVAEKLVAGRDIALAAKRLVELDRNVDLQLGIGNLKFEPDWEKVRCEYEELGFKSIAAKLPGSANTSEVARFDARRGSDSSEVSQRNKRKSKTDNPDQLELI